MSKEDLGQVQLGSRTGDQRPSFAELRTALWREAEELAGYGYRFPVLYRAVATLLAAMDDRSEPQQPPSKP